MYTSAQVIFYWKGNKMINTDVTSYSDMSMGDSNLTKRFRSEASDEGWYVISTSWSIILPKVNDSGNFQKIMVKIII